MEEANVDAAELEAMTHAAAGIGAGMMIVWLVVMVVMIAALWKIFTKAGQPGWASIIPIYNAVVMCQVAGKPGWWVILMLIPLVNIVIGIIVTIALAQRFGRGIGTIIGLILLPIVFFPILGFGSARYQAQPA